MFKYLLTLFALYSSVFAATGGGLINTDKQIISGEGKDYNSSIALHSSNIEADEFNNLMERYDKDDFLMIRLLMGWTIPLVP